MRIWFIGPWVNNCVGHKNHKLFVVFLIWGVTGILYAIGMFGLKIIWMLNNLSVWETNKTYYYITQLCMLQNSMSH